MTTPLENPLVTNAFYDSLGSITRIFIPLTPRPATKVNESSYETLDVFAVQSDAQPPASNYSKWTIRCYKTLYCLIMFFSLGVIVGFFARVIVYNTI